MPGDRLTKRRLQAVLQRLLGFQTYLFLFGLYSLVTMRWAEPAFDHFLQLAPDNGVLLDVGANLGVTTTLLARKCPHATVLAFEPVPWNVTNIRRLVQLFQLANVSLHSCALGDNNGPVEFVVPIVCGARMHGLGHIRTNGESGERLAVACHKLDDMALANVTAIKLDVENSEYSVLCGASALLTRWQPLMYCEVWNNENGRRSLDLLHKLGYVPYIVESGRLVELGQWKSGVQNLILIPSNRESDATLTPDHLARALP
jgi:FkbM family methyltransferase